MKKNAMKKDFIKIHIFATSVKFMRRIVFLLNIVLLGAACRTPEPEPSRWYKGDLHAHYLSSGGTAARAGITDWYARRGYGFVVIDTACHATDLTSGCLALPGSECVDENGVWTTAVNTVSRIWTATALREEVQQGNTSPNVLAYIPQDKGELVSHHLRNIRRAGGLAMLSRSTLQKLTPEAATAIEELQFIEIFDGDTLTEAPWDSLLTRRKKVFAVASDTSWAGRACVMLQADSLTPTCGKGFGTGAFLCFQRRDAVRHYTGTHLLCGGNRYGGYTKTTAGFAAKALHYRYHPLRNYFHYRRGKSG